MQHNPMEPSKQTSNIEEWAFPHHAKSLMAPGGSIPATYLVLANELR